MNCWKAVMFITIPSVLHLVVDVLAGIAATSAHIPKRYYQPHAGCYLVFPVQTLALKLHVWPCDCFRSW